MLKADWNNEQLLMSEFREGNKDAFHHIYTLHHTTLYYFTKKITGSIEEAEDIVADTFVKLWNRRHTFEDQLHLRSYLFIMARNACLDYLKSTTRLASSKKEMVYLSPQGEEHIQAVMIKADLYQKALDEMRNMPPGMRKVFKLIFVDDLTTEEVAQQLGISEETVRSQKAKALELVRGKFRDKGFSWP